MSLLNRISKGLVVQDTFDSNELNPMWQVSPSDESRYSLTERPGFLRLKHGDPDIFVLMTAPRFDFVMELDTDYDPIRVTDQGGLVAFRDQETRLELLEYYDPTKGTMKYDRIRMVRKSDLFEGYGTNDNGKTWELIGTTFLSAPKIGMVLHGALENQSDTLDIQEFKIYRSTNLQVGNLSPGITAQLISDTGVVLKESVCKSGFDFADLDVSSIPFPIKGAIKIIDSTNLVLGETELFNDIWGGDVFWYGAKLDIEIDGVGLREDREYQFGNMSDGSIEKKIYIINNNDMTVPNVRASIMAFNDYLGWEWVDIAPDIIGEPGTYKDNIIIGNVAPKQKIPLWIKIIRQPYKQLASLNDYKFRIMFESG